MDSTKLENVIRDLFKEGVTHKDLNDAIKVVLKNVDKQKVVINRDFGGFGLSQAAVDWMLQNGYTGDTDNISDSIDRDHPLLVACVEALGDNADGDCADLGIVEVPIGSDWQLDEYDGIESVSW